MDSVSVSYCISTVWVLGKQYNKSSLKIFHDGFIVLYYFIICGYDKKSVIRAQ